MSIIIIMKIRNTSVLARSNLKAVSTILLISTTCPTSLPPRPKNLPAVALSAVSVALSLALSSVPVLALPLTILAPDQTESGVLLVAMAALKTTLVPGLPKADGLATTSTSRHVGTETATSSMKTETIATPIGSTRSIASRMTMMTSSQLMLAAHAAEDATVTLGMLTTAAAQALETTSVTSLPAGPMITTALTTMKRTANHAGTSTFTSIISRMSEETNATGTGAVSGGAVTMTTAISWLTTTVAHAVVDATVTPMILTAAASKKMAEKTQRHAIALDVFSANAGTTTSLQITMSSTFRTSVAITQNSQKTADRMITSTSQLNSAVPAEADAIATH